MNDTSLSDTRSLARIEGRLEGMCEHIDGRLDEVREDIQSLRARVDRLDRISARHGAIAGGGAAIATVGLALLADSIRKSIGLA